MSSDTKKLQECKGMFIEWKERYHAAVIGENESEKLLIVFKEAGEFTRTWKWKGPDRIVKLFSGPVNFSYDEAVDWYVNNVDHSGITFFERATPAITVRTDMSRYPHTCDCGHPAYRGQIFGTIKCSNSSCKHYEG
jgi:hypothetical protein